MKSPKITAKDQYVQDIRLSRGTYTFSAWVLNVYSSYSIGLKTQSGQWLNFDMSDQLVLNNWAKVRLTFTLYEPCVQFSLMNSNASSLYYVFVAAPMLEEGTNAGTHKPNDLDLDESIGEGSYTLLLSNQSHTFAGSAAGAMPGSTTTNVLAYRGGTAINPTSITVGAKPTGMTSSVSGSTVTFTVTEAMTSPSGKVPITFVVEGKTFTLEFSYAVSLKGSTIYFSSGTNVLRKMKNGTWVPEQVNFAAYAVGTTITTWEYSVNGGSFTATPPAGVTRIGSLITINANATPAYAMYSVRVSDGVISDTMTVVRVEDGQDGDDGKSPYIGENGTWWVWDGEQYVDSGVKAEGQPGDDGAPAYTVRLTNESHIFAGTATAAQAGSATTDVIVLKGGAALTPASITVGEKPTGMTSSVSGSKITFTVTSSMVSPSGTVPVTVVADGKTFTVEFSYSIAFRGADGLSKGVYLTAQTNVIKIDADGMKTPASTFTVVGTAVGTTITTWEYSVNGAAFSSGLPTGVTRSGDTVTVNPNTVTFVTLAIRCSDGTISDVLTITVVSDGNGLPGRMPITIEWAAGDAHLNNSEVINYIYYRPGGTWWRLKDGVSSPHVAPASPDSNYVQLSMIEQLATKIIIAENANLAGFIFKEGRQISQRGTVNGAAVDYAGQPNFIPNVFLDGGRGEIKASRLLNPFTVADPDIEGDVEYKLADVNSIFLEASGPVTWPWLTRRLAGDGTMDDRHLDGVNVKIYAPYGCNRRVRIYPAHLDALIFDPDGNVWNCLEFGVGTRQRIHLSAVWDRVYNVLDWVVTSWSAYTVLSDRRVPLFFKPGDIIATGQCDASGNMAALNSRYTAPILSSKSGDTTNIDIQRSQYFNASGTLAYRTVDMENFTLDVYPTGQVYASVRRTIGTNTVQFGMQFKNTSNTTLAAAFYFVLRAAKHIPNSNYLDYQLPIQA